jgi:hypothetical protein
MFAIRWSDVGRADEPGEQKIEALTLPVEQEHIARWKVDPEGIWEIAKDRTDDQDPSGRWVLTRWHPSGEKA